MASELYVETLKGLTSGANANKVIVPAGQTLDITDWSPPAGTILQVVEQRITNSTFSSSSATYTDVTDCTATITPSSTSSKIYVHFNINGGSETQCSYLKVLRGTTDVFIGSGNGQVECASACSKVSGGEGVAQSHITFIDTPSTTSAVTYKLQTRQRDLGTFRLNINQDGTTGSTTKPIAISSIILMEIAG